MPMAKPTTNAALVAATGPSDGIGLSSRLARSGESTLFRTPRRPRASRSPDPALSQKRSLPKNGPGGTPTSDRRYGRSESRAG